MNVLTADGNAHPDAFLVQSGVTDVGVLAERIGVTRWSVKRYKYLVDKGSKLIGA